MNIWLSVTLDLRLGVYNYSLGCVQVASTVGTCSVKRYNLLYYSDPLKELSKAKLSS